jgi:hypothetical protein
MNLIAKSRSTVFVTWSGMLNRCHNSNSPCFHRYGGRGIKVCDRWLDFENFRKDMGERPFSSAQIDRIDNDGDYEPLNCRWATLLENIHNKGSLKQITYKGETHILAEWAKKLGIEYGTLYGRIYTKKWNVAKAFETPLNKNYSHKVQLKLATKVDKVVVEVMEEA